MAEETEIGFEPDNEDYDDPKALTNSHLISIMDSSMTMIISLADAETLNQMLPKYDEAQEDIIRCLTRTFKLIKSAQELLAKRIKEEK